MCQIETPRDSSLQGHYPAHGHYSKHTACRVPGRQRNRQRGVLERRAATVTQVHCFHELRWSSVCLMTWIYCHPSFNFCKLRKGNDSVVHVTEVYRNLS